MNVYEEKIGLISWNDLLAKVEQKIESKEFILKYLDDENEEISLSSESELNDAYQIAKLYDNRLKLVIKDKRTKVNLMRININLNKVPSRAENVLRVKEEISKQKSEMIVNPVSFGELSANVAPQWFTTGLQQLKVELSEEFDRRIERIMRELSRNSSESDSSDCDIRPSQRELTKRLLSDLDAAINYNDGEGKDFEINSIKNKLVTLNSYNASFVKDCNIPDGSKITASTSFNKSWLLSNCGILAWKQNNVRLVNVAGNIPCLMKYVPIPCVDVNNVIEVQVSMVAPSTPGLYYSEWVLMCRNFIFGPRIWCKIEVIADGCDESRNCSSSERKSISEIEVLSSHDFDDKRRNSGILLVDEDDHFIVDREDEEEEFVILPDCFNLTKEWPSTERRISETNEKSIEHLSQRSASVTISETSDAATCVKNDDVSERYLNELLQKQMDELTEINLTNSSKPSEIDYNDASILTLQKELPSMSLNETNEAKAKDDEIKVESPCVNLSRVQKQAENKNEEINFGVDTDSLKSQNSVQSHSSTRSIYSLSSSSTQHKRPVYPETPMEKLIKMGFANRQQNRRLLDKYNDCLEKVVADLVQIEDNNWFERY